jgi:hypothetical protein
MLVVLLAQSAAVDSVWVAVLSVLATGGLAALVAAMIAFIKGWSANKRVNEKSTIARQGELLDRYEKHAAEERQNSQELYAEIAECAEDRARWEEWGTAIETWANHQNDLARKRGEEPIPVPPSPPRRPRPLVSDLDFRRRTSAQTGENLKALATMIRKDGLSGGGKGDERAGGSQT